MAQVAAVMIWRDPPADLAGHILGFAHRNEAVDGKVVRLLPEVRGSIQVMAADPYWLRERAPGSPWRRVPQVALWAPRHAWGYGFATGRIHAFAIALTGTGMRTLVGTPVSGLAGQVLNLGDSNAGLAVALAPFAQDTYDSWTERAVAALRRTFSGSPAAHDPVHSTLNLLATAERGAVAQAADAARLSERQYRRVFRDLHGTTPKHYQRIVRVDRMLRQLQASPWEADGHVGHPIPFADQPHAIREFRALTGLTPTQYERAKRAGDATLRSVAAPGIQPPLDGIMSPP